MFGSKTRERKRHQERRALEAVARHTVLFYFQSWGQNDQERISALCGAVEAAGIKAKFVQLYDPQEMKDVSRWGGTPEEIKRAEAFRKELAHCFPLGQFEQEQRAVMSLISRTRDRAALAVSSRAGGRE